MARRKKESAAPLKWEDVPEIPREEQPYPLPEGWKWVYLGNAIELLRGVSYSKNDVHKQKQINDCLVLRGGNIKEGYIDFNDIDNVYVDKYLIKNEQLICENDVVIVSSTGSIKVIGRAGISNISCKDVAFGAFLTLARPNDQYNKRYVNFFFQGNIYRNRIKELVGGININNIKKEYITLTPFPCPSLEIQQRIVTRIESLFSKLDEAAEKVQAVIDSHEARKQAILHQAFSGELTRNIEIKDEEPLKDIPEIPKEEQPYPLPKGWKWTYLGDAVELLRGVTYSKKDAHKEKKPGDCLILRGGNIKEGYIDFNDDDNVYVDKSLVKKAQLIREYDVLIVSSTGSIKVIGRAGISNVMCKDVAFGAFLTLARPNDKYNKRYVNYFFQSGMYRNRIKALVNGVNINNIKKDYISWTPFAFPPLKTQEHIVNILTPVLSHLDSVTRVAGNILDEIAQLKQSILNKAFGGELA